MIIVHWCSWWWGGVVLAVTTQVTNRAPREGNDTGNVGMGLKLSCFRPPYCQSDPANEFCLTVSVPRVAAWHWSLSGLRGQGGCEMPSVVILCSPFPFAQTQQERKATLKDPVKVLKTMLQISSSSVSCIQGLTRADN